MIARSKHTAHTRNDGYEVTATADRTSGTVDIRVAGLTPMLEQAAAGKLPAGKATVQILHIMRGTLRSSVAGAKKVRS